ncbi:unnamed protein product [Cylindrotheca closterium]|uniref:Sugar-phosphatase n=1 Tax=Cylindrotheca closterium TaxID=2856 RepID=A0AAD2FCD8_9STRA|nr:unnamed protein product [Cylindrotheca closterium]
MHGLWILQSFTLLILSRICSASSFAPAKQTTHHALHISSSSLSAGATGDDDDDDDEKNDEFLERLTQQYLGSNHQLPEGKGSKRLGDLYDPEELSNLLNVHKDISSRAQEIQEEEEPSDEMAIPSIHDLVMEAVGETPDPSSTDENDNNNNNDEVVERLTKQYLGSNPGAGLSKDDGEKGGNRLADFYDADTINNLLELHTGVSAQTQDIQKDSTDDAGQAETAVRSSIHDLVLGAGGDTAPPPLEVVSSKEEPKEESSSSSSSSSTTDPEYTWLTEAIREKMNGVKAIASDVDGTLIGSASQTVHPRTKDAVSKAVQDSFSPLGKLKWFFPATGKTRWGAMNSLGPELAGLLQQCPGVFIQGLYCMVGNTVVFERKLPKSAIEAAENLVAKTQTSIIAYDGDHLYTTKITPQVRELHQIYGEPMSEEIPSIAGHAPGIHKLLIYDDDLDKIAEVRIELEALAKEHGATVTQAIPTMLELLPEGCSKALGVQKVCEVLGLDPTTDLMALGDAENDVEMLQLAAVGVCVGNGSKLAKDAADIVLEETSDEGAAGLAIEVLTGL